MKASCRTITIGLQEPFVSNTSVTTEVHQVLLTLSWQGLAGYGTAHGASLAEVEACIPLLANATLDNVPAALRQLRAAGVSVAVISAADMALHDLRGKTAGQPLHRLLNVPAMPLPPTALSLGAGPDEDLIARARAVADWPVLKLKLTPADDGRRVGVLRSVYEGRIRVDANGSWSADQALRIAEMLHKHDVELMEQPVAPGRLDDLLYVHERSPVPVFADEDCAGPADLAQLQGRVSGVNIKLVKCGGIASAREMILLARTCGLQVMLGCKLESALGVTAIAQLAGLADHLDLDGHLALVGDPFTGAVVERGLLTLPTAPGLGASLIGDMT